MKKQTTNWIKRAGIAMLVSSIVLAGCGGGKKAETTPTPGAGNGKSDVKIGMVTNVGGVNDKSFNQGAWDGLQNLGKETGASVKYLESKSNADYIPNLSQFVKGNYDLTWGIGLPLSDAVKEIASKNPEEKLAIIDNVVELPNVASILFSENEGSFLAGVVAGMMTKTNKVAFIGGLEIPVIKRFEVGFKAGVLAANPDAKVSTNYTGAFDKPDFGKAAAASMYNSGVDIIFHASGETGNGVFNEAKSRVKQGKTAWVIGVDMDQSVEFGDEVTLTSMVKRVNDAVLRVSKDMMDGKFAGGKTTVLGLKENGVGLADTSSKNVPADVLAKVEEFKAKIISGEIKVPTS
ncbi:BMP family ABC transporter substrate-binding protein [Paenibacillus sp. N1-5-1-14]|uniref:BMP family lipoprotein n=1 Tax=Paenibacillus radicibacter TaxID=2972488 RepID=UPI0021593F2C|nr:BMP family ABC transporter substrate-binding protein [Paenibacillus radicibacter]MCR8644972.1 BMP family ABC transporter substrate-binding protein [Paenibacillus radicibacter]